MLMPPPHCWRGRTDCEPLHAIEGFDEEPTEELMEALWAGEAKPASFVCAGCVHQEHRTIPRDAYRVCWKNKVVDEIGDYDEQDLTHMLAVISQALAIIAARRINSGMIEVPVTDHDGAPITSKGTQP